MARCRVVPISFPTTTSAESAPDTTSIQAWPFADEQLARPLEFTERELRIMAGQSLWLDAGEPDHLAPFFCFVGNELSERGGRSRQRYVSEVSETGIQLGIDKPGVDRFVQHLDNLSRGVA